ncbi:polymorphic toxin-type HINT domain-containing protein [Paenibacillus terreus]
MKASWQRIISIILITVFMFGYVGNIIPQNVFADEEEEAFDEAYNLTIDRILQQFPNVSRSFVEAELAKGHTLLQVFSALSVAEEKNMSYESAFDFLYPTEVNPSQDVTGDVYNSFFTLASLQGVAEDVYGQPPIHAGAFIELGEDELPQTVFGNVYGEKPLTPVVDDVYTESADEVKVKQKREAFLAGPNTFSAMAATKPDIIEQPPVYDKNKLNQAPFSIGESGESISTLSGGLSLESTDMSLPGRNGLGFTLKRQYNSNDAQFYDMTVKDHSYNQGVFKHWVIYNIIKKKIIAQYMLDYKERRWKQYDYNNDGLVDTETTSYIISSEKGPYNSEVQARNVGAEMKTYTIPADSRRVTDSRTGKTNQFPSPLSYNKNGYSGKLYFDGSPVVISGSYSPGGTKTATKTCTTKIEGKYDANGVWKQTGSNSPSCPQSYKYDSDGYKGTLTRTTTETVKACPSPNKSYKNYKCTKTYRANYSGKVSKPAVDTRTWKQSYSGTVTKPGYTSTIGYSNWVSDGRGSMVRDAYTLSGTPSVRQIEGEGNPEKQKVSYGYTEDPDDPKFDPYQQAKAEAEIINDVPGGILLENKGGYRYYTSAIPNAYVWTETIGSYRVRVYNNELTKPTRDKLYPIGKGWTWKLPYIETELGTQYIRLADGGRYEIEGNKLKGYEWEGLSFKPDTSVTVNNERSAYVLTSMDETWKQHFTADGRILQISDNYNNQVLFGYTKQANGETWLTSVQDAIGNTIRIAYSATAVVLTKGNERVVYQKHTEQNVDILDAVTDAKGLKTSYGYKIAGANVNLVAYDPARGLSNPYVLLTKVQHPTGAESRYEYEGSPVKRYMGEKSYNEAYRIKTRADQITYTNGFVNEFNPQTMFYTGDMGSTYKQNIQFSVAVDNGLQVKTYNYKKNYIDDKTSEQYYLDSVVEKAESLQRTTTMSYGKTVTGRAYPVSQPTTTRLTNSMNADTLVAATEYNDYGNVLKQTEPTGATTVNTYDGKQLLQSTKTSANANGDVYVEYTRNSYGDVTRMVVRQDGPSGKVLQQVDYNGFDSYGNVTNQTIYNDNKQIATTTEYSSSYAGAFPTAQSVTVTDADGRKSVVQVHSEYDPATGLMTSSTDGKNQRTQYKYDVLGRVTEVVNPDGTQIQASYDDIQNTVTIQDELGTKSRTRWNALGWQTESGLFTGQGFKVQSRADYDAFGRLSWEADGLGNTTNYYYDNWSRPVQTSYADGSATRVQYNDAARTTATFDGEFNKVIQTFDPFGRQVKTEEATALDGTLRQVEKKSYDPISDNVTKAWDGNDQPTSYSYDFLGQLTSVTNAKDEVTKYSYDQLGNNTAIQHPDGNRKQKTYNELNQIVSQTDEKGQTTKLYYDANNNMTKRIDRNGNQTQYEYDARNRLVKQTSQDQTVSFTYDDTGKRLSMTDNTGKTSYQYDRYTGLLKTVTYPDGLKLTNEYDLNGNRTQVTDPFGQVTKYVYDGLNRVTALGSNVAYPVAKYAYTKNGLAAKTLSRNGVVHESQYDGGVLAELLVKQNLMTANTFKYTRDGNKNIVGREQNGAIDTFKYDQLSRIAASSEFNETYSYDQRGNRQTLTTDQAPNISPSEYTFDAQDRLTQVQRNSKTVQYKYNGDGLLVGRIQDGVETRYYYDGDQIIAEAVVESGTPKLKASYVRGSKLEAIVYPDGSEAYPVYNGHGDLIELRDKIGNILNKYSYDIWGNITNSQEQVHNPFRYSGELWDEDAELQYLRARWYDPAVGRFINEDTNEGETTNPLSLNLYTYVVNNPLIYMDPSGHYFETLDYQELRILLNEASDKSNSSKNQNYKLYKDFIRERYDFASIFGGENRYNYLYDLLTGTSGYKNSAGKSDWAREQLLDAYQKWTDKQVLEVAAGGLVGGGKYTGKGKAKSGTVKAGARGCNCFTAGTKVQTDEGEKNIEDIEVGDKVLAKDENNPDGELAYKEVTNLYRNQRDDIIKLHVGEQIIETTDNHPFWVEGKGWVFADELQVGDKLQKADGSNLTIDKVEFVKLDEPVTVYNFTVADYHTYYVTDIGIWVHNTQCGYKDITVGKSVRNIETNVTRVDFEKSLVKDGWTKSVSKDGKSTMYSKDGASYRIRDKSDQGLQTADYWAKGATKVTTKIRLGATD